MFTPDDKFINNDSESNLPPHEDNYVSDETTIEDFFDKVVVEEKKEAPKVVIIKPDNNSGIGEEAPESIAHKFNWGAFLFNWVWGFRYKKWFLLAILVLSFIPYGFIAGFVMALWAGAKGNQWAWEEVQYKDEEDFHKAQQCWVKWWLALAGIGVILGIGIWSVLPKKTQNEVNNNLPDYSFFTTSELDFPQDIYDNTRTSDKYFDLLTSDKYIIYWLKPKNDLTLKNKEFIEEKFKNNEEMNSKFVMYSDLIEIKDSHGDIVQNEKINENKDKLDISANCSNNKGMCFEAWLYENCNNGYCIINPQIKKYYKVRGKENVIPKALKIMKSWN